MRQILKYTIKFKIILLVLCINLNVVPLNASSQDDFIGDKESKSKKLRKPNLDSDMAAQPAAKRAKKEVEPKFTSEQIELQQGKGSKGRGSGPGGFFWHIWVEGKRRGCVFINKISEPPINKEHASIQIFINKSDQGKGIGRIAYSRACLLSFYDEVYAYMRKNNKASIRAAVAAGFIELSLKTSQVIMKWIRPK
ncbi:MAG: GNAT family N-acetyltransferase [Holosporales bacterium]|nr:GNAT family N-acetyltransferase [Holosporales bacterium]